MIRDPAREHADKEAALRVAREAERLRMSEITKRLLTTEDGQELLLHLSRKFHLHGRSFVANDAKSAACPYAAATRDGEKAVLWYLIDLSRLADPEFLIP